MQSLEVAEKERYDPTKGIPSAVYNEIVKDAKTKFPDDASVQDWEIHAQVEAYKKKNLQDGTP